MYILNSEGSVVSCNNDTAFGWWLTDFAPKTYNRNKEDKDNISVQRVNNVEKPNVSQEICKCCTENNNEIVFIPPIEKMTDLLDGHNSKDRLLFAIIHPTMWNKIYKNDSATYANKIHKHNIASKKADDTFNNNNYKSVVEMLKLFSDEPVSSLESQFEKMDNLLKDLRHEILEMHRTLENMKQSYIEEESYVDELIQRSICYTQDILDTQFLDDLLMLSNDKFNTNSIKNWPFYSDSAITYASTERNYII